MGIYPEVVWEKVDEFHVKRTTTLPGVVKTETYALVASITVRDDCFCCSCGDSQDPYCRNHGFYGKRPCEEHKMSGSPIEDTDEMPESVQAERARQEGRHHDRSDGDAG